MRQKTSKEYSTSNGRSTPLFGITSGRRDAYSNTTQFTTGRPLLSSGTSDLPNYLSSGRYKQAEIGVAPSERYVSTPQIRIKVETDDAEQSVAVSKILRRLSVLHDHVLSLRIQSGFDVDGEEAVWVWCILRDDNARRADKFAMRTWIHDAISQGMKSSAPPVYVRFQSASEL